MPKLTQALLDRASKLAKEFSDISSQITDAFEERYGVTHSDVDADYIIDALDYGQGSITLAECDKHMAQAGYPRIRK